MKCLALFLVPLFVSALANKENGEKEKRGVADYTNSQSKTVQTTEPTVAYSTARSTQQNYFPNKAQNVQYAQPQYNYVQTQPIQKYAPIAYAPSPQQQYEQAVQYIQPAVTKVASQPAFEKYAVAPAPAPIPIQYSAAPDVSSFSYSSPFVSYNNLGVLAQPVGKLAPYPTGQPIKLLPSQPVQYSSVKGVPQQVQYTTNKIVAAPQQFQYNPVKVAATHQALQYAKAASPQQISYITAPAPLPANQQIYYVPTKTAQAAPQQLIFAAQQQLYNLNSQKFNSPQFAFIPPQLSYNIPQQQQLPLPVQQYEQQAVAQQQSQEAKQQGHESNADSQQTSPQPAYTAAPQINYEGVQKSGVTYA